MKALDWIPKLEPWQQTVFDAATRPDFKIMAYGGRCSGRTYAKQIVNECQFLIFIYDFKDLVESHYSQTHARDPFQSLWNHESYLRRRQRHTRQGLTVAGTPRKRLAPSSNPHATYMRQWRQKQKRNQFLWPKSETHSTTRKASGKPSSLKSSSNPCSPSALWISEVPASYCGTGTPPNSSRPSSPTGSDNTP